MVEYKEFRITVHDPNNLQFQRSSGVTSHRLRAAPMKVDPLIEDTIVMFSRWLTDGKIDKRDELVMLGTYLYKGLFDSETSSAFAADWDNIQNQQSTSLRLVLEFEQNAHDLAIMPWEYIYYPDSGRERGFFLATRSRLILARHALLDQGLIEGLKREERPLRILIVVSKPERDEPDGEVLGIVDAEPAVEAIEKLKREGVNTIVTDKLLQPTKSTLIEKVVKFRPHVLHFIGHGRQREQGGALALVREDDEKIASWISDEALADIFANYHLPRLIFLHACEGAYSKSYKGFRGIALQLIYSKVPAVVAMQYQIDNRVGNLFAQAFYQALGEGNRIDEAVQAGRLKLGMYLDEGQNFKSRAFGSPVVYLQSGEGIIIAEAQAKAEVPRLSSVTGALFKCPECFKPVIGNQNFCTRCGTQLMICPTLDCHQIMAKNGFCGACGYSTTSSSVTSSSGSGRVDAVAPSTLTRTSGQSSTKISSS